MPRLSSATPKYRKHRASGRAVVTIQERDHYLGPYGSRASRIEYDRLVGEWLCGCPEPSRRGLQAWLRWACGWRPAQ